LTAEAAPTKYAPLAQVRCEPPQVPVREFVANGALLVDFRRKDDPHLTTLWGA
jgi:hypothetical protein